MSPMPPRPPRPDLPDSEGAANRPPRPDLPGAQHQHPTPRPDLPGAQHQHPTPRPDLPGAQPLHPTDRPDRPEMVRPEAEISDDWKSQAKLIAGSWFSRRKKELPSWKSFHPQDMLWWVRKWWRRSSRGGRAFGLLVAFLCLGAMLRVVGCGGVDSTPQDVISKSGNNPEIIKAIQTATNYVQSAPTVQSSVQTMKLTVTYQQEPNLMIVQNPGGMIAVDANGKSWDKQTSCWKASGSSEHPNPLTVVLPLQEPSVRFQDIKTVGSTQTMRFQAQQLGSWGAGSGQLQLQDGHPTQFSYQSDADGSEAQFILTYPSQGPVKNLQPKC